MTRGSGIARKKLTLVKLGGSLITHKDHPDSANIVALNVIAKALKESALTKTSNSLILVHGGGSFGHFYAHKAGLSTIPKHVSPHGIALTNQAMLRLHMIVTRSLMDKGFSIDTILPSELLSWRGDRLSSGGALRIKESLENGLVPISFGYVSLRNDKAFVLSGDTICLAISRSLPVERVIFAMDVDGIYPNPDLKGGIIRNVSRDSSIFTKTRAYDVTGGIRSKLELGLRLHKMGVQVFYVNGTKPDRLLNLLAGRDEPIASRISEASSVRKK